MNCKTCKEPMEYFGSNYVIENGKKHRRDYGVCTRHIPYTPITFIKKEVVE